MTKSKIPGVMVFDMMAKAGENPDFPVVTFENHPHSDEILTYSDLVLRGNKLAREMENMGIGRGDTFSIVMRNHPEFVEAMIAASITGCVFVPIDPRTQGDKLGFNVSELTESVSSELHYAGKRVLVERIEMYGPAFDAGFLRGGFILIRVDGENVDSLESYNSILEPLVSGSYVVITYLAPDRQGELQESSVTVGVR